METIEAAIILVGVFAIGFICGTFRALDDPANARRRRPGE